MKGGPPEHGPREALRQLSVPARETGLRKRSPPFPPARGCAYPRCYLKAVSSSSDDDAPPGQFAAGGPVLVNLASPTGPNKCALDVLGDMAHRLWR